MAKTKKEIVKILLNQDLDVEDEEKLIEMLIEDPIAVDIDKASGENLKCYLQELVRMKKC